MPKPLLLFFHHIGILNTSITKKPFTVHIPTRAGSIIFLPIGGFVLAYLFFESDEIAQACSFWNAISLYRPQCRQQNYERESKHIHGPQPITHKHTTRSLHLLGAIGLVRQPDYRYVELHYSTLVCYVYVYIQKAYLHSFQDFIYLIAIVLSKNLWQSAFLQEHFALGRKGPTIYVIYLNVLL